MMTISRRAVLLDRDGTIIKAMPEGEYLTESGQIELLPGVAQRIKVFNELAWPVLVVTNQQAIGLGLVTNEKVEVFHNLILQMMLLEGAQLNGFLWCPHKADANCFCRKPRPGLLYKAAVAWQLDLRDCILFGDSDADMEAARAANVGNYYKVPTEMGLGGFDLRQLASLR